MLKLLLLGGLAVVSIAALIPVSVTIIERQQAARNERIEPGATTASTAQHSDIVVYFSRSGNTALAARHIAARIKANIVALTAPDYELGLAGWARAMRDARSGTAEITPREIDLSGYGTVFLGTPIWLYSPAPPIWAFIHNNRFDGKRVVLFNTFNSAFGPEQIEAFRAQVMERGAASFTHWHVRRGRMTQQISPEEMLAIIDREWLAEAGSAQSR